MSFNIDLRPSPYDLHTLQYPTLKHLTLASW